jgi:hypothetical protein
MMAEYINDVGFDEYKRHGDDKMAYDLNTPHPGYGKDPNIKNEFGHTNYPKYVTDADGKQIKDANGQPIIANNPKEEHEAASSWQ